jgi:hypothetical protein
MYILYILYVHRAQDIRKPKIAGPEFCSRERKSAIYFKQELTGTVVLYQGVQYKKLANPPNDKLYLNCTMTPMPISHLRYS